MVADARLAWEAIGKAARKLTRAWFKEELMLARLPCTRGVGLSCLLCWECGKALVGTGFLPLLVDVLCLVDHLPHVAHQVQEQEVKKPSAHQCLTSLGSMGGVIKKSGFGRWSYHENRHDDS